MLSSLIARRWVGRQTLFLVCCLAHRGLTGVFLLLRIFSKLFGAQGSRHLGISIVGQLTKSVSSFLIYHGGYHDLWFVIH